MKGSKIVTNTVCLAKAGGTTLPLIPLPLRKKTTEHLYFYGLKTKRNEQAQLLEMCRAFSFIICTFSITICVK